VLLHVSIPRKLASGKEKGSLVEFAVVDSMRRQSGMRCSMSKTVREQSEQIRGDTAWVSVKFMRLQVVEEQRGPARRWLLHGLRQTIL
jgi:hypothetical protein